MTTVPTAPPYMRVTPVETSSPLNRSAEQYLAVVNQFEVQSNPRYQPHDGQTFCNIFAWDVTSAMGREIPHWVDPANGKPVLVGRGAELNVNATLDWLEKHGPEYGWQPATAEAAELLARAGKPVVAMWRNPSGGHGHVAVVIPGPERKLTIAQAGGQCLACAAIERGFGSYTKDVKFYAAD